MGAIARVFRSTCILAHLIILSVSSIAGLVREDKADIINVFINAGPLSIGIFYLIRCLDDFKVLFSSIFDIADKSLAGFSAHLLLEELIHKKFQIGGLSYKLKNGGEGFRVFLFDIISFALHLAGNFASLLGREKRPRITVNNQS